MDRDPLDRTHTLQTCNAASCSFILAMGRGLLALIINETSATIGLLPVHGQINFTHQPSTILWSPSKLQQFRKLSEPILSLPPKHDFGSNCLNCKTTLEGMHAGHNITISYLEHNRNNKVVYLTGLFLFHVRYEAETLALQPVLGMP